MATEVSCGHCHGQLLVEELNVVVACPHCGTHVSFGESDDTEASVAVGQVTSEAENADHSSDQPPGGNGEAVAGEPTAPPVVEVDHENFELEFDTSAEDNSDHSILDDDTDSTEGEFGSFDFDDKDEEPAPAFSTGSSEGITEQQPGGVPADDVTQPMMRPPELAGAPAPPEFDTEATMQFVPASPAQEVPPVAPETAAPATEAWTGEPTPLTEEFGSPEPAPYATPGEEQLWNPEDAATDSVAQPAVPVEAGFAPSAAPVKPEQARPKKSMTGLILLILVSYASALTIAFIFLMMKVNNPQPHQLESLPDLVPDIGRNGKIGMRLAPQDADMANGHTLRIGESQRFGSVRVTPVKVTKGSLEFDYYDRNADMTRPAASPVLKLWLKFENVSKDQVFPPLDRKLLLARVESNKGPEHDRANTYLCKASEKRKGGERYLVYGLPETSSWDFRNQELGNELSPGDSVETYIPSVEIDPSRLKGNLVWRVQFRKGYNPESLRGVTTLIEISFDSSQIVPEGNSAES